MIEDIVLSALMYNEDYTRRVFPFLKEEYFDTPAQKTLFSSFQEFFQEYNKRPTKEVLALKIDSLPNLNEVVYGDTIKLLEKLEIDKDSSVEFLIDETEKFCKDRALFNAIKNAISIIDGTDKKQDKGAIPKSLEDALAITFDDSIGHDFLNDSDSRYDYYHRKELRIPFDIEILNKITRGGLPQKSLTILAATTGGGKSLTKCHMSAHALSQGKNVLYITMEMAEEEIAKRIEANLFDIDVGSLMDLSRAAYDKKIERLKETITGKLIVKEYPTGAGNANHFRNLINELRLKKNFFPDIIFIDYMNICSSSRYKGSGDSSYMIVKAIAEELRGLSMEFGPPVVTSTQLNRGGYNSSEIDLTNMSESMGPSHTADLVLALIATEELDEQGKIMIKQLKNRWGDLATYRKFLVGIDRSKMRLINLDENKQPVLSDSQPEPEISKAINKKTIDKSKISKMRF